MEYGGFITMCFSCKDCVHYQDGKCDADHEVDSYADAFDCTAFEERISNRFK